MSLCDLSLLLLFVELFSVKFLQPVYSIMNCGKGKKKKKNCCLINYFQLLFLIKCMVSLLCECGCVETMLFYHRHICSSPSLTVTPAHLQETWCWAAQQREVWKGKVKGSFFFLQWKGMEAWCLCLQDTKQYPHTVEWYEICLCMSPSSSQIGPQEQHTNVCEIYHKLKRDPKPCPIF